MSASSQTVRASLSPIVTGESAFSTLLPALHYAIWRTADFESSLEAARQGHLHVGAAGGAHAASCASGVVMARQSTLRTGGALGRTLRMERTRVIASSVRPPRTTVSTCTPHRILDFRVLAGVWAVL